MHSPRTTIFIQIKGKKFFLTAGFVFCATDTSNPKMVAAVHSKLLLPVCKNLHSITDDIFIVITVRTTDLIMAFSFYFSFIWKGENFEVQTYLNLFLTPVMKTVYRLAFCVNVLLPASYFNLSCPKYGKKK